jgi:hypothetical protein
MIAIFRGIGEALFVFVITTLFSIKSFKNLKQNNNYENN